MADTLKTNFIESTDTTVLNCVPANVDSTKTVLSIVICNTDASDSTEFDLYYYNNSTNIRIYNNQSLPALSTFIHDSKLIVMPNHELQFVQSGGTTANPVHIITSYLAQTSQEYINEWNCSKISR